MLRRVSLFIVAAASLGAAIVPTPALAQSTQRNQDPETTRIRHVLDDQQAAWNRGDIEGFMRGYWNSPETVFVSEDEITRGWQTVHDRYRSKYSDRDKMGALRFSELEIRLLGEDVALVLGRWELVRKADKPHGRFTLIFRKTADGWKIVHDHTSAANL